GEGEVEAPARDGPFYDLADFVHEISAVVADVDADHAQVGQREELLAEEDPGAGATRSGRVDDGRLARRQLRAQLLHRAYVAPGAERVGATLGDDVGRASGAAQLLGDRGQKRGAARVFFARDPADLGAAEPVEQDVGFGRRRLSRIGHAQEQGRAHAQPG